VLRILLAVAHLLGFGIALGSIYARARTFNRLDGNPDSLRRGFAADTWWGVSAVVLLGTGLWRAFAGLEKTPSYYWHSHVFYAKMGLLVVILLLEIWPMLTLMQWRMGERRGTLPAADMLTSRGKRIARISDVQLLLLVGMIVAAVMMARGYGYGP
jgi:putative membrane protein